MSELDGLSSTASTTQPTNFAKEEWEDWMKWDGPLDSLSANTPQHSPPPLQYVSGSLGSTSPSELDSLPPVNFSPVYALPTTESKKRKSSSVAITRDVSLTGSGRQPRGKKISHNVIEKRYRSNLNDKIAKLRDSVPELRTAPPTIKRRPQKPVVSDSEGSGDDTSQGLKFNKATVLIKATEYIQQLERQNQRLLSEVSTLRNRNGSKNHLQTPPVISTAITKAYVSSTSSVPQAPEKPKDQAQDEAKIEVGGSGASGMIEVPADIRRLREEVPHQDHYAPGPSSSDVGASSTIPPWSEVKGMIPLSESWQRFRARPKSEDHYAPASPASHILELEDPPLDDEGGSRWSRSRMMSRVLVGSLAGLMVMEGFSEQEEDSPPLQKRGLFSLPNELLTESRGFRVPIRKRIIAFGTSGRAWQALPILSVSCVFLMVFFVVFVYSIPQESKAIREGPVEEIKDSEDTMLNSEMASPASPTSSTSPILRGPESAGLSNSHGRQSSSFGEFYALKLIQWFGLSWLISQTHDEEAASRLDIHTLRRERWLGYLRVIPRFGEDMQAN